MKELTIEEKAARYDKALLNMKRMVESGIIEECYAKGIFSEFEEESEDEKIRKTIIEHFEGSHSSMYPYKGFTKKQILAWLEKQGEQKTTDKIEPIFKVGDIVKRKDNPHLTYILKRFTDDGDYEFHAIGKDGNEGCTCFATVKYQDEWELVEQKPVVPKKVGDWIVKNDGKECFSDGSYVLQIKEIYGDMYTLSNNCYLKEPLLETYRLWTIQDAKDGDVLCYKDEILLYKHDIKNCTKQETIFGGFVYHCCYDGEKFIVNSLYSITEQDKMDIHPATKEQRDTLMKAMADAGYEWDAEKKELKNVEEEYKGEDYGIDGLYAAIDILQKTLGKVEGYQTDDGILEHKCAISAVKNLYDQNPIWSEDDERLFQIVIDILDRQNQLRNISLTDLIACVKKNSNLSDLRSGKPTKDTKATLKDNL